MKQTNKENRMEKHNKVFRVGWKRKKEETRDKEDKKSESTKTE